MYQLTSKVLKNCFHICISCTKFVHTVLKSHSKSLILQLRIFFNFRAKNRHSKIQVFSQFLFVKLFAFSAAFFCFGVFQFHIFLQFSRFLVLFVFCTFFWVFRCFCTQCLWIIFCGITGNKLSSVQEIILGSTTRIKKILKGDDFCKARNQTKRGVLPRHAKEIKTLRSH